MTTYICLGCGIIGIILVLIYLALRDTQEIYKPIKPTYSYYTVVEYLIVVKWIKSCKTVDQIHSIYEYIDNVWKDCIYHSSLIEVLLEHRHRVIIYQVEERLKKI